MKRVLLWLLALVCVTAIAQAGNVTIYMVNKVGWNTPWLYAYDENGDKWHPMTKVETCSWGDIYSCEIDESNVTDGKGFLFANGKEAWGDLTQTEDLSFSGNKVAWIIYNEDHNSGENKKKRKAEGYTDAEIKSKISDWPFGGGEEPIDPPTPPTPPAGKTYYIVNAYKDVDDNIVFTPFDVWMWNDGETDNSGAKFATTVPGALEEYDTFKGYTVWKLVTDKKNLIFTKTNWGGQSVTVSNAPDGTAFYLTGTSADKLKEYPSYEELKLAESAEFNQDLTDYVIVGEFSDESWNVSAEKYKMTRNATPTKVEWMWEGTIEGGKYFHFAGWNDSNWSHKIYAAANSQKVISEASGSLSLSTSGGNDERLKFSSDFEGTIKIIQTEAGYSLVWNGTHEEIEVLDYNMYIVGENNTGTEDEENWGTWDSWADYQKFERTEIDGGYRYVWTGQIRNANDFNFCSHGDGHAKLALGFADELMSLDKQKSEDPLKMKSFKGDVVANNITFPWALNSTVKITLTLTSDGWTMKWDGEEHLNNPKHIYLKGSELNAWEDELEFELDDTNNYYVLDAEKHPFVNASITVHEANGDKHAMTSSTLTNLFYIQHGNDAWTFTEGPVEKDKWIQLVKAEGDIKVGDNNDHNMKLKDLALENVVITYNPTTHEVMFTGQKSPLIDARTYSIYYKLSEADYENGNMKPIYLWAWGNSDAHRDGKNFLGTAWPGIQINKEEDLNNQNDTRFSKLTLTVNGETSDYLRYELNVPAGNSTIGVIFSNGDNQPKTDNMLDTEFQDGRIYGWNAIHNEERGFFFAKVALRVVDKKGNRAMCMMNTEDGETYTLDVADMNEFHKNANDANSTVGQYTNGRYFVQDWVGGHRLDTPNYNGGSVATMGDYHGFYIVRTRDLGDKAMESESEGGTTIASIRDYRYYYTHNGGVVYGKTQDLETVESQLDHITWDETNNEWLPGTPDEASLLADEMMTFNAEEVDNLHFEFDLLTGNLTVTRDGSDATRSIIIYLHNPETDEEGNENPNHLKAPMLLIKGNDGKTYTANAKTGTSGSVVERGEAMIHAEDEDETLWRYEITLPETLYTLVRASRDARRAPSTSSMITTATAGLTPSNVNLTFVDGDTTNVNPTSKTFVNAPLVNEGVYSLSDLETVYLIDADTDEAFASLTYERTVDGARVFQNTSVDFWFASDEGGNTPGKDVKFYVSTSSTPTAEGAKNFGAESEFTLPVTLLQSQKYIGYGMNAGTVPYVLDLTQLSNASDRPTLAVTVMMNEETDNYAIGIALDADNIQTGIESVEGSDEPVMWFNLQGVRVAEPTEGVFIRVQGTETTKVLVK